MNLILPSHKSNLKRLVGSIIEYAIIPNLSVCSSAILPDVALNGKYYGHFYESYFVYLRILEKNNQKTWLKIAPGPDEPIEPWAPIWVEEKANLNLEEFDLDKDVFLNSVYKSDQSKSIEHYLDSNIHSFGFTKLRCWGYKDEVSSIKICDYSSYASCIFKHKSGKKWSIYAEYDFEFWLNFNQDLAEGIEQHSFNTLLLQ